MLLSGETSRGGGAAARVQRAPVACPEVTGLMTEYVYGKTILRIKNTVTSYTVGSGLFFDLCLRGTLCLEAAASKTQCGVKCFDSLGHPEP